MNKGKTKEKQYFHERKAVIAFLEAILYTHTYTYTRGVTHNWLYQVRLYYNYSNKLCRRIFSKTPRLH